MYKLVSRKEQPCLKCIVQIKEQGCFYFIISSDTALLTKTMHHGQRDCASIVMTLKETEAVQLTMVLSLLSSTVFHDLAFVTWWRM